MTIQDVIDNTHNGVLPNVNDIKDQLVGTVTTIRITPNGYRGIAVRFNGRTYDSWYYEEPGTDKRKRYMHHLVFNTN